MVLWATKLKALFANTCWLFIDGITKEQASLWFIVASDYKFAGENTFQDLQGVKAGRLAGLNCQSLTNLGC